MVTISINTATIVAIIVGFIILQITGAVIGFLAYKKYMPLIWGQLDDAIDSSK